MILIELAKHEHIGVDFDGTLIDHPRCASLQRFILDHPEKHFHIVTFRSHGMEAVIERDLKASTVLTGVPLRLDHFVGIHNVADEMYEAHVKKIFLIDHDPYWHWKAKKCAELGCTVMIDDMIDMIGRHCEAAGIICLNPDHL